MPDPAYLFIQPWFHPDETWAGFQVCFRGPPEAFPAALARLSAHPALPCLDQGLPWFIPVEHPDWVETAAAFPVRQPVLLACAKDTVIREIQELQPPGERGRKGLMLAPNMDFPRDGFWEYAVLDASHARTLPAGQLVDLSREMVVAVTGLRSHNDLTWASTHRCTLVTGEYLLDRSTPCQKPDILRLRLLNLLALIAQDADTREIEDIFRHEPKLAYGLLRLVNSAALAPRTPITGFAQAITILGRRQLQRWLQLLVYADANDGQHPNPLLLLAAARGRMMETLAGRLNREPQAESSDGAFMVGAFSLLDILFNLPMAEILAQMPVPESVQAALEAHTGPLGELLHALDAADNYDFDGAGRQLAALGIDSDSFTAARMDALSWAADIRSPGV